MLKRVIVGCVVVLAAAVVLSGCGGGGKTEKTATPAAGKNATATVEANAEATATVEATSEPGGSVTVTAGGDLVDIPVYAGVKETGSLTGLPGAAINAGDYEKVVWKYYTSDATAKDIMDWYRTEMTKSQYGWAETLWTEIPGQGTIGVWSKDGDKNVAWVYAAADPSGNGTVLAIMEALNKK